MWKATFNTKSPGLKDKVFNFVKKIHDAEFVNNCEAISKFITMKYTQIRPKMVIATNNMDKPTIIIPIFP